MLSRGFGKLKNIEGWVPAGRKNEEERDVDSDEEIKEEEDIEEEDL